MYERGHSVLESPLTLLVNILHFECRGLAHILLDFLLQIYRDLM